MCSIEYYNQNADAFYERTIHADVSDLYKKFLFYVKSRAKILDAGCGVGRDSKYFSSLGYDVTAFDGSLEMVKKARQEFGANVLHCFFQELCFVDEFDALWASASLLHVPFDELKEVILKFRRALKKNGVFFASFKYGESRREVENRAFYDFNEKSILPYLNDCFHPIEIWKSADTISTLSPSPQKAWLNLLCKAI